MCQNLFLQTVTCYSDPDSHPFISEKELNYLKTELGQTKRNNSLPPTPWSMILTNVPVLALVVAQVDLKNEYFNYFICFH